MPPRVFLTQAKDHPNYIEVSQFNRFYTFQVDPPIRDFEQGGSNPTKYRPGLIETRFILPKINKEDASFDYSTTEESRYTFRLRAELSTGGDTHSQQGMRVSLIEEETQQESLEKVVDIDTSMQNDEGIVTMEVGNLKPDTEYVLRYQVYEKDLLSLHDKRNADSASSGGCSQPFITQQLLIIDNRLVRHRIHHWKSDVTPGDIDGVNYIDLIRQGLDCKLERFNNTQDSAEYGEDGVFCMTKTYTYPAQRSALVSYGAPSYPREVGNDLFVLYEKGFQIRGITNEPVTYWYHMQVGFSFLVSSGIRLLLTRDDLTFDPSNPFACLYDKSCAEAKLSSTNTLTLDLILTSGLYKIVILEKENRRVTRSLTDTADNQEYFGLEMKPISFSLESYPVLQNEERVNCPYMYLEQNFLQRKYLDNGLDKFIYSDRILMNLFNLSSNFVLSPPNRDSLIKIRVKEAFGVNARLVMCEGEDCLVCSSQVGTTEVLLGILQKGHTYSIEISFSNSLIEMSDFFTCPYLPIEVTVIPVDEAQKKLSNNEAIDYSQQRVGESLLNDIFQNLTQLKGNNPGYTFMDDKTVFKLQTMSSSSYSDESQLSHREVTSKRLQVKEAVQISIEIFYEPFFYDLELSLISKSMGDTEIKYYDIYNSGRGAKDLSLFTGSKQLYLELEPGDYEFKIIQILGSWDFEIPLPMPNTVEFQLRIIANEKVHNQHSQLPTSLNYLGLVGQLPMTFFCEECLYEEEQHFKAITLETGDDNLEISILLSSQQGLLSINLEEVSKEQIAQHKLSRSYFDAFESSLERGTLLTSGIEYDSGETLVTISSTLKPNKSYRIVLLLKSFEDGEALDTLEEITYTLRIDIHRSQRSSFNSGTLLPRSVDEFKRLKYKSEGMKESEFLMGSRAVMKWMSEQSLNPFERKQDTLFKTTKLAKDDIVHTIKFEVKEEEALVYVALLDYSSVPSLIMEIAKTDPMQNEDEYEALDVSVAGQHYSYIEPISLTKGDYYLTIRTTTPQKSVEYKFSLDMLYESEKLASQSEEYLLNSIELCGGHSTLPRTFNLPAYLSSLNGQGFSTEIDVQISDALFGDYIEFKVEKPSLGVFYIELPKEIEAEAVLTKSGSSKRLVATTDSLNANQENFLRVRGLKHINVIQVREFLTPGDTYSLRFRSMNPELGFVNLASRCQTVKFSATIEPLHQSNKPVQDKCMSLTTLGSKLDFAKHKHGTARYDVLTPISDTTYIKTDDQGEGPFFFFFSASYDPMSYEGQIGLVLYKYDSDSLTFHEIEYMNAQNGLAQIVTKIEEGTYVLLLESLTSSQNKFTSLSTATKDYQRFNDPCLALNYSYYITSTYDFDTQKLDLSFMDLMATLFTGADPSSLFNDQIEQKMFDHQLNLEMSDQLQTTCDYDELPTKLEPTEAGYDFSLRLQIPSESIQTIEIIAVEQSVIRVLIQENNPKDNINMFLYNSKGETIGQSESNLRNKELLARLGGDQKPYKLKIVFDSVEFTSTKCPLFDMRIALTPITQIIEDQTLTCLSAIPQPPKTLTISSDALASDHAFVLDESYQLQLPSGSQKDYQDIQLSLPSIETNRTLYFDFELSYDFQTQDIDMQLIKGSIINSQKKFSIVSRARTEPLEVTGTSTQIVKRIKAKQEYIGADSKYWLRITTVNERQNQFFQDLIRAGEKNPCIKFDLSMRVSASLSQIESRYYESRDTIIENELVRVHFIGQTTPSNKLFDPREKLVAVLQFKQTVKDIYKNIKHLPFAYLLPQQSLSAEGQRREPIFPIKSKIGSRDKSQIVLTFNHGVLKNGECYQLEIDDSIVGLRDLVNQDDNGALNRRVCMTNCQCNSKGMKDCDENTGKCECHKPFTGDTCSQCLNGFSFIEHSQDCLPTTKCSYDGGSMDCNGHGTCYYEDGQPQCACDDGFANNGLDLCGKCKDPLFTFPDCLATRQWLIENSDHQCDKLQTSLPMDLSKLNTKQQKQIKWHDVYHIGSHLTQSEHIFSVQSTSLLRLFLDTHQSGLSVSYTLLDSKSQIVYKSGEPRERAGEIYIRELRPTGQKETFKLMIEYEQDATLIKEESCPRLEILFSLKPVDEVKREISCTDEQSLQANQMTNKQWYFGERSEVIEQTITVSSEKVFNSNTLNSNQQLHVIPFYVSLTRQTPAPLTVIFSHSFEYLYLKFTLRNSRTKDIVGHSRLATLDQNEDSSQFNMLSLLELDSLEQGDYIIELEIQKFQFMHQKNNKPTCLTFKVLLEYVAISPETSRSRADVLSIIPMQIEQVINRDARIEVRLNKELVVDSDYKFEDICWLVSTDRYDDQDDIDPQKVVQQSADTLLLYFFFPFDSAKGCYHLECDTDFIKDSIGALTNYCFPDLPNCNPNAHFSISKETRKCQCGYPYKGELCEECEVHYLKTQGEYGHTLCNLDESRCSEDFCNSHGTCFESGNKPQCRCDEKYDGLQCDRCKDTIYAYPDCDSIEDLEIYEDSDDYVGQPHFQKGKLQDQRLQNMIKHASKLTHTCPQANFPQDLTRLEYMNFLPTGDFHIADYFMVNHNTENIIKFIPQTQGGQIKILLQQPLLEELLFNEDALNLELSIYDMETNVILATQSPKTIRELQSIGLSSFLDYNSLSYQFTDHTFVEKELYLLFKVSNETALSQGSALCQRVFLEISYTSQQSLSDRNDNNQRLQSSYPFKIQSSRTTQTFLEGAYTVTDSYNTFFFHQDMRFEDPGELTIKVLQKFEEANMIDMLIEEMSIEEAQESSIPTCKGMCIISGQKSFNEMRKTVQVPGRSIIRVWLFQSNPAKPANFNLLLQAQLTTESDENQLQSTASVVCENEIDFPSTLIAPRYDLSKGFYYIDRFRVDDLPHHQNYHDINFNLQEPTMIRIVGLVHKHLLEFDLQLLKNEVVIMKSEAQGSEDNLFAQLDSGSYSLRVIFSSTQAHIMRQPCQSIEIAMAFQPIARVKTALSSKPEHPESLLSLSSLFIASQSDSQEHEPIYRHSSLKTFALHDSQQMQHYYSFVELFKKSFTFQQLGSGSANNHGSTSLLIKIESDFLTNDVSVQLTNKRTGKVYKPTRGSSYVQLVAENMQSGDTYEVLIYAFSSVTNIQGNSFLQSIDADFNIDLKLFNTAIDSGRSVNKPIMIQIDGQNYPIAAHFIEIEELNCIKQYESLPEAVQLQADEERSSTYYIPISESFEHLMEFTPPTKQSTFFRVLLLGRPNSKISLYKKNEYYSSNDAQPVAEHYSINNGIDTVLIASNLQASETYILMFEFGSVFNDDQLGSNTQCDSFVLSFLSSSNDGNCMNSNQVAQLPLMLKETGTQNYEMTVRGTSEQVKLQIGKNVTEFYIEVDYTAHYYIPSVKILKESSGLKQAKALELRPSEVSHKHQGIVLYKWILLDQGISDDTLRNYTLIVSQAQKKRNCPNSVQLKVLTISTDYDYYEHPVLGTIKTFTSQEEQDELTFEGISLPQSLNTYKYLHKPSIPLVQVTEYFEMNTGNSESNKLSFTLNENQGWKSSTLIRVMLEDSQIIMQLYDTTNNVQVSGHWKSQSLTQVVQPGSTYEIRFDFPGFQKQHTNPVFRATILIADHDFYINNYLIARSVDALKDCENNVNLPLALNKNSQLAHFEDEQVYDYPVMRLSGKTLSHDYVLDSFNFRINETSRFFMQIGTHTITSMVALRLSELSDYGNAYIGKQSYSLNTIDLVLGPGDYQLQIEQPLQLEMDQTSIEPVINFLRNEQSSDKICGLFSFFGRVTPLRDIEESSVIGGSSHYSQCDIREVLPSKIYKSEAETKNGLEYFINNDGTFSHYFTDLLIKSPLGVRHDNSLPFDRVELTPPENGLLSVTLQHPSDQELIIRVYDVVMFGMGIFEYIGLDSGTSGGGSLKPVASSVSEASGNMLELSQMFALQGQKQYFVIIYYKPVYEQKSGGRCSYYNMMLGFSGNQRLLSELKCLDHGTTTFQSNTKLVSLISGVPSSIQPKGDGYQFSAYYEIKYPTDFSSNSDDNLLLKDIDIQLPNNGDMMNIESRIKFDAPLSFQEISLFAQTSSKAVEDSFEDVAVQLPFETDNGNDPFSPTMVRDLRARDLSGKMKYKLAISDQGVAKQVLGYLNQLSKTELCLYSFLEIKVDVIKPRKVSTQQKSSIQPMLTSAYPELSNSNEALKIQGHKKDVQVSLTFNTMPYSRNYKAGLTSPTLSSIQVGLSELITLNFYDQQIPDRLLYKKPAKKMTIPPAYLKALQVYASSQSKKQNMAMPPILQQPVTISFVFDIERELKGQSMKSKNVDKMLMKLQVYMDDMVDREGKKFSSNKGLILPQFRFEASQTFSEKKSVEQKIESQADKLAKNNTQVNKKSVQPKDVKCLCIHGYCKQGESQCFKCYDGWTGTLCDTSVSKTEANQRQQQKPASQESPKKEAQVRVEPMVSMREDFERPPIMSSPSKLNRAFDSEDEELVENQSSSNRTISLWNILTFALLMFLGFKLYQKYKESNSHQALRRRRNKQKSEDGEEETELIDMRPSDYQQNTHANRRAQRQLKQQDEEVTTNHLSAEQPQASMTTPAYQDAEDDLVNQPLRLIDDSMLLSEELQLYADIHDDEHQLFGAGVPASQIATEHQYYQGDPQHSAADWTMPQQYFQQQPQSEETIAATQNEIEQALENYNENDEHEEDEYDKFI